jgi:hypothetical protein
VNPEKRLSKLPDSPGLIKNRPAAGNVGRMPGMSAGCRECRPDAPKIGRTLETSAGCWKNPSAAGKIDRIV